MKNGYIFEDTFNNRIISRHIKRKSAVKSIIKWKKEFNKHNSNNSYLSTQLIRIQDGQRVARIDYDYDQLSDRVWYYETDLADINGNYEDF